MAGCIPGWPRCIPWCIPCGIIGCIFCCIFGCITGSPLFGKLSKPIAQAGFGGLLANIVPLGYSSPAGDGELLKKADGDDS